MEIIEAKMVGISNLNVKEQLANALKELNNPEFRSELLPIVNRLCDKHQQERVLLVDDIIRYVIDAMVVELVPPSINNQESE